MEAVKPCMNGGEGTRGGVIGKKGSGVSGLGKG